MAILSMCTGVGALDSAVEALTGEVTTHCAESDPAASAVLAYRFPEMVNLGDISQVDWAAFAAEHPEIDITAAGFPCQNISNAGRREGITGEKSRVWASVADAIGHIRPRIAFLENVGALRSRGLDTVTADLARIGYDLRWATLQADVVGAAHVRRRWFGIAAPEDADGEPRIERVIAAPRQEAGGGHGPTLDDEVSHLLPHPKSLGWPERWPEPEEQQGRVRRPSGDGGEPAADPDHGGRDGGGRGRARSARAG